MPALGLSRLTLSIRLKISGNPPAAPASLHITWDDSSEIEDGYRVRWEPTAGGTEIEAEIGVDEEEFVIGGLAWNTQYDVSVVAYNEEGESNVLGPVSIYTAPPLPPTACDATATGTTTATVGWTLPGTEPITGYRIYRSPAGAGTWTAVGTVAAGVNTYAATGLSAGTAYDFRVTGYNSNAAESQPDSETDPSNTDSITTDASDVTAPTYTSSAIPAAGTTVVDTYNETLSATITTTTGRTITMSGGAVTLSGPVASGATVTWTTSRTILAGETCSANAYAAPGTGIKDAANNYAASYTGRQADVTNNSTASGAAWFDVATQAQATGSNPAEAPAPIESQIALPAGTVTKLRAYCSTVGGVYTVTLLLYEADGTYLGQGTVSTTTGVGTYEVTLSSPVAIAAGNYRIGGVCSHASNLHFAYSTAASPLRWDARNPATPPADLGSIYYTDTAAGLCFGAYVT